MYPKLSFKKEGNVSLFKKKKKKKKLRKVSAVLRNKIQIKVADSKAGSSGSLR